MKNLWMPLLIAALLISCKQEQKNIIKSTKPIVNTKADTLDKKVEKQIAKDTSNHQPVELKADATKIQTKIDGKTVRLYGIQCVIPKTYKPAQKDFKVKNLKGEVVSVSSKFVAQPNSKEITIKSYPSHKKPKKILTKTDENLINFDGKPGLLKTELLSTDGKGHPLKNKLRRFILRIYPENKGEIKIIYTAPIASADKDFGNFVHSLSF